MIFQNKINIKIILLPQATSIQPKLKISNILQKTGKLN